MPHLLGSEELVRGGTLMIAAAVILAVTAIVTFTITGRRLKKRLEEEYGKPQK